MCLQDSLSTWCCLSRGGGAWEGPLTQLYQELRGHALGEKPRAERRTVETTLHSSLCPPWTPGSPQGADAAH